MKVSITVTSCNAVMPVVFRETLGHAKVPSTLPSLDLVLELGLMVLSPRAWVCCPPVPLAQSNDAM